MVSIDSKRRSDAFPIGAYQTGRSGNFVDHRRDFDARFLKREEVWRDRTAFLAVLPDFWKWSAEKRHAHTDFNHFFRRGIVSKPHSYIISAYRKGYNKASQGVLMVLATAVCGGLLFWLYLLFEGWCTIIYLNVIAEIHFKRRAKANVREKSCRACGDTREASGTFKYIS